MKFYSTNRKTPEVNAATAVMAGLADDGGLFMPKTIPRLSKEFFNRLASLSIQEIGLEISSAFFSPSVSKDALLKIVTEAINFEAKLVTLSVNQRILELFHGPTLAFKDFGARFMARLIAHLRESADDPLTILVATSGDTGSAVAHGFYQVPGIRVVLLYPKGKVSDAQEAQFTTLGKNISALAVNGSFDDCQQLVKQAFVDRDLKDKLSLASANSINIARLVPQSFYFFYAYSRCFLEKLPVVFSVPSGNYGNLTAGLIAKLMGLPIRKFVAATNVNNIVPEYLQTGEFRPRSSVHTISNAMDVGNPSNFARLHELYSDNKVMGDEIFGISFSDEETNQVIAEVHKQFGYLLDPHGAVAYLGLKRYQVRDPETIGIALATAHPAKFLDTVKDAIGVAPVIPERLSAMLKGERYVTDLENDFQQLKTFLLS